MKKKTKTSEVVGDILLEGCLGSLFEGCFSGCLVFILFFVIITGGIMWFF